MQTHFFGHIAVFLEASLGNIETCAKLCLVCKTSQEWMTPLLYETVALTSSSTIRAFARTLKSTSHPPRKCDRPTHGGLGDRVCYLWIGPTTSTAEHDLPYASTHWSIDDLQAILMHCSCLRSLAIVNLAQHLNFRINSCIPSTVENIYLGPVHGSLDLPRLPCLQNLRSITSLDTFFSMDEMQTIVASPYLQRVRRFYGTPAHIDWAFRQLSCLRRAGTLEELQVVCCDNSIDDATEVLKHYKEAYVAHADERVLLVARAHPVYWQIDGIGSLHQDWLSVVNSSVVETMPQASFKMISPQLNV
ncbi:hypothetical protein WOLCODRAFT_166222 [Wolfiporia cocos MD-104 SS10]|uniref:F-box domain-containing protein n=1 Tax=Wolfiporia cocos (strain MD-104) TaxID=742152 RepID=A0A2H3JCG1_WOLCO|nr:hypothetical protein WOLCODRAFT_166222 [Wolfiporia cocos MD-104 SS10]